MSGEHAPIIVVAERGTVLAQAVEALGRFPVDQSWVLIGGIAVLLRLGTITRPTADADTVARSQAELLDQLTIDEPTVVISAGEIEMPVGDGLVQVDVMDLDDPLPGDIERRAFALGPPSGPRLGFTPGCPRDGQGGIERRPVHRAGGVACGAGLLEDRVDGPAPARQPPGEGWL